MGRIGGLPAGEGGTGFSIGLAAQTGEPVGGLLFHCIGEGNGHITMTFGASKT